MHERFDCYAARKLSDHELGDVIAVAAVFCLLYSLYCRFTTMHTKCYTF